MSLFKLTVSTLALSSLAVGAAQARDEIRIVGSSTVFPYTQAVAEQFANVTGAPSPIVESTGTGGGMKIFCAGIGEAHPDLTGASRAMKASEYKLCQENGVTDITEAMIGYDGLSIAISRDATNDWDLSLEQVFLALAAEIPSDGGWIANPNKTWRDVDPSLPNTKIEVLGPPPTSGTRDAFNELAVEGGCKTFPTLKAMKKTDKRTYKALCRGIREDGGYIEAGENDNLIVQKLDANPNAFGVFGYSFLDQNADKIQGSLINGVTPEFQNIAAQEYPVSRPLFIYVKKVHVGRIPGIKEFVAEFTSEKAWGDEGYLADRGLIPMPDAERKKFRTDGSSLNNLSM
jgi:phosphate transport system substrate-binding protein